MLNQNIQNFPKIKRAREYRLYAENGKRYLDMYLNKGFSLLGHRPESLSLIIKSTISKGLLADYPSIYSDRLIKALKILFPDYENFKVFANKYEALNYYKSVLRLDGEATLYDPLLEESGDIALWRPFSDFNYDSDVIMPVLPFFGNFSPVCLCFKKPFGQNLDLEPISPFLLAGLTRIVFNLIKSINAFTPEKYLDFPCPIWNKKGLYLLPRCSEEEYQKYFKHLLENGIIISPYFKIPSIIPLDYSEGEIKVLKKDFNG